jgi:adenylate kinase
MQKQVKTIEFFGLPGSGKTTLLNLFVEKENTFPTGKKTKLLKFCIKFYCLLKLLSSSPSASIRQIELILRTKQRTLTDLIKVTADWLYTLYVLKEAQRYSRKAAFDQGIVQALWSINLSAGKPLDLETFLKDVKMPDAIVLLEVDQNIICERLLARPGKQSRLEKENYFSADNIDRWQKPFEVFSEIKLYLLKAQTELFIISNNNENEMKKNIDMFRQTLFA